MSRAIDPSDTRTRRTSELLEAIAAQHAGGDIAAGELLLHLGDRGYGFLLLVLAVLSIVPNVPGFSGIVGVALMALTAQMVLGRRAPWLPRFLRRRRLPVAKLRRAVVITVRALRRIERLCRPRLGPLVSPAAERLYALVILYLALLIALPIPVLGNVPPAIAITILAFGLLEKDGIVVLIGLAVSILAAAVTLTAGVAAANGIAASITAVLG